jgi:hypothetical protein
MNRLACTDRNTSSDLMGQTVRNNATKDKRKENNQYK